MKINITIEIDDKELKGLIFGEEKPKTKVDYVKAGDFRSRMAWERLLYMLNEIAAMYEVVTVADYLDITGERKPVYTDNKYGWTKQMIRDAKILSDDGRNYLLVLPKEIRLE